MTIKALYPNVRPTLNLDFAKTKALDPRVTFTRASTGTFVGSNGLIQTAASGAARFDHNPETGESLGLLVEEARTNLITQSNSLSSFSFFGHTLTQNVAISPDNTINASSVTSTGSGNCTISLTTAANSSCSIYFKANSVGWVYTFITGDGDAWFDLQTGAKGSNGKGSIQSVGNGWFRVNRNTGSTGSIQIQFFPTISDGSYNRTAGNSIFVYGAQVEAGSFPTSYIPTTTATVTRAADVASMTGTNFSSWYRQDEGSLVGSFIASNSNANVPLAAFYNAANLSNYRISFRPGNTFARNVSSQFEFTTSYSSNILNKFAWGFGSTAVASKNGSIFGTDNSVSLPLNLDRAIIGQVEGSGIWLNGTIARLAYYPVRLPDAQLQALTAT